MQIRSNDADLGSKRNTRSKGKRSLVTVNKQNDEPPPKKVAKVKAPKKGVVKQAKQIQKAVESSSQENESTSSNNNAVIAVGDTVNSKNITVGSAKSLIDSIKGKNVRKINKNDATPKRGSTKLIQQTKQNIDQVVHQLDNFDSVDVEVNPLDDNYHDSSQVNDKSTDSRVTSDDDSDSYYTSDSEQSEASSSDHGSERSVQISKRTKQLHEHQREV